MQHPSHQFATQKPKASTGTEMILLCWAHGAIAILLAILGIAALIPSFLAFSGMILFGGIGIVCALLTITRT